MTEHAGEADLYGGRSSSLARLHAVLTSLHAAPREGSLREAWCLALAISDSKSPAVMRGIGRVAELADLARIDLGQADDPLPSTALRRHWKRIDQLLSLDNLGAQWGGAVGHLDPPLLDLMLTEHLRTRYTRPQALPPAALGDLRQDLSNVESRVIGSAELSVELRAALLDLLRQAKQSLDAYALFGSEGVARGMAATGGLAGLHADLLAEAAGEPLVEDTIRSTGRVARAVAWMEGHPRMVQLFCAALQMSGSLAAAMISAPQGDVVQALGPLTPPPASLPAGPLAP